MLVPRFITYPGEEGETESCVIDPSLGDEENEREREREDACVVKCNAFPDKDN